MTNLNQPIQLSHQRLESLFNRINQAAAQPEILSTLLEEFSITLEEISQQQQESYRVAFYHVILSEAKNLDRCFASLRFTAFCSA